jgi:hypothetical protein
VRIGTSLKHHGRRSETAEMKLLKSIAGFALHDQRGNQEASEELNIHSLLWIIEPNWHCIHKE